MRRAFVGVVLLVLGTSGCGAMTSVADAGDHDHDHVHGTTDAGTSTGTDGGFDAGVDAGTSASDGGVTPPLSLNVEFENSPITRVGNMLHVTLTDAASKPVTGATMSVLMTMPTHGHVSLSPTLTEEGDGHYHGEMTNFSMAGTWNVKVDASKDGLSATSTLSVVVP